MSKLEQYRDEIMKELVLANTPNSKTKDILIVVRDQLPYVKECIDSVRENTEDYHLLIFDNGSNEETKDYLNSLPPKEYDDKFGFVYIFGGENNLGFIEPNNTLASFSNTDYMILLNSDCVVRKGWDLALVNYLEQNSDVAQVGYCGAKMDQEGHGTEAAFGSAADFICGWCFCISKNTYEKFGLFDEENLEFAYGEDSDFSLRIKAAGKKIYSLHNDLVIHHGNKTINQVYLEKGNYLKETFKKNHEYIKRRWLG